VLRVDRIKAAADDVVAAAIIGEGWEEALARFSHAAGAHGAVLMRNEGQRLAAALPTQDVADAVADFAAGRAPPSSRYSRVRHGQELAFRVDHDDYTAEQLAADPFYQEFLRPIGYFWHANVALAAGPDEWVELSLKRRLDAGPYERADAVALDAALPELCSAARLARHTLDAEARGMARLLLRRGASVFELDRGGRVRAGYGLSEIDSQGPIRVLGRRLVAADPALKPGLDRAVGIALGSPGAAALAELADPNGRRHVLHALPVPGRARDVFLSSAALAVLTEVEPGVPHLQIPASVVRDAFGLTGREAEVASLLAQGASLVAISRRLRIEPATARTHLKRIFEKTRTRRQTELVALLSRLHL
jgi:DNA-binding CsgD family transcriptional regulator